MFNLKLILNFTYFTLLFSNLNLYSTLENFEKDIKFSLLLRNRIWQNFGSIYPSQVITQMNYNYTNSVFTQIFTSYTLEHKYDACIYFYFILEGTFPSQKTCILTNGSKYVSLFQLFYDILLLKATPCHSKTVLPQFSWSSHQFVKM